MSNNRVPISSPLVFRELQGVKSYAELLEVLNFNFSRIANSPYFRGKLGLTGEMGNPGFNGPRGNNIYYVDINRINSALGSSYNLDTNQFDIVALNAAYRTQNSELKVALRADTFVQHDWCLLPNGTLTVLYDIVSGGLPIDSEWIETDVQFLTSADDNLLQIITEIINSTLGDKTLGSFKLYDAAFNIVKDDPNNPNAGTANISAGPAAGGLIPILAESGPTYTNDSYVIAAINEELKIGDKRPLFITGKPNDWYASMQTTLPIYGSSADSTRNISYTPNKDSVPGGVIMQANTNNGLMFGLAGSNIHEFGMLYKTAADLKLTPKFSWDRNANSIYDKRVNSISLANAADDASYIATGKFLNRLFRAAGTSPNYFDAAIWQVINDKPTLTMHDNLQFKLPAYLANGFLFASNRELTIASFNTTSKKVIISDPTAMIQTAAGNAKTFAAHNANGEYIEIPYPLTTEYISIIDLYGNDVLAHIKHQHPLIADRSYAQSGSPDLTSIALTGSTTTIGTIAMPDVRPIVPDTIDVLIHVAIPILAVNNNANAISLADIQCTLGYGMYNGATSIVYTPIEAKPTNGIINISHAECNGTTPANHDEFMNRAKLYEHTFIIRDLKSRYATGPTSSIPGQLSIKNVITVRNRAGETITGLYTANPILTILPLITDAAINRHTVPDPGVSGVGYWVIADLANPTDIDFIIT